MQVQFPRVVILLLLSMVVVAVRKTLRRRFSKSVPHRRGRVKGGVRSTKFGFARTSIKYSA